MQCWSLLIGASRLRAQARRFSRADERRIQRITAEHFPSGFTVLAATGGWFDPDQGKFVVEESRQVIICGASAAAVRIWAEMLGRVLRQKELVVMRQGDAIRLHIRAVAERLGSRRAGAEKTGRRSGRARPGRGSRAR
jgi:hypothetical protein